VFVCLFELVLVFVVLCLLFFFVCLFVVVVVVVVYCLLFFVVILLTLYLYYLHRCKPLSVLYSLSTRLTSHVTWVVGHARHRSVLTDGACASRVANLCSTSSNFPLCSKLAVPQILYIIDCWYLIWLHGLYVFYGAVMFIGLLFRPPDQRRSERFKLCCLSFYTEPLIF